MPRMKLDIVRELRAGERTKSFIVRWRGQEYRVDMFFATPEERPFALFHWTGPKSYNIRTRAHAKKRGWRLNRYGLFYQGTDRRVSGSIRTETDLARKLGVTPRPPAERR